MVANFYFTYIYIYIYIYIEEYIFGIELLYRQVSLKTIENGLFIIIYLVIFLMSGST